MNIRRLGAIAVVSLLAFSPHAVASAPSDAVRARAETLYGLLLEKNARHFRIRDDLRPFFATDEDLSAFLVRLAKDLDEAGIQGARLEERRVAVKDADLAYGFAETDTHLEGDWILWFNRSINRLDRWKLVDGQWYVNPAPLKNLDFK